MPEAILNINLSDLDARHSHGTASAVIEVQLHERSYPVILWFLRAIAFVQQEMYDFGIAVNAILRSFND